MSRAKYGLTLGKFAPLHRGHQFLFETALAEMDKLLVLVYDCPEATAIPLSVRSAWIRELYPQVETLEVWDGPDVVGDTPEIRKLHDDHLAELLRGRELTHFYSSEFYGEHVSRGLGLIDRRVDPPRAKVPVSASAIRRDPARWREFIDPRVYRDLIVNVVLLGAPSTGKTTLAERLAAEYNTVWMPEYGREYWDLHQVDRRLNPQQLVEIAEGHLQREEAMLAKADRFLFTDTNALTTRLFARYYHGFALEPIDRLAEQSRTRYDLVFLCEDDIPYDNTWDRSGEANRRVFQRQTLSELARLKIPYCTLSGSLDERLRKAKDVLGRVQKFGNPAQWLAKEAPATDASLRRSG